MSYYQYIQAQLVPGSLQILVSSFFVFGNLSCVFFFMMISVCKEKQTRLLKNVNKHFRNFGRWKILQINSSECWTVLIHTSNKRPLHSLMLFQIQTRISDLNFSRIFKKKLAHLVPKCAVAPVLDFTVQIYILWSTCSNKLQFPDCPNF